MKKRKGASRGSSVSDEVFQTETGNMEVTEETRGNTELAVKEETGFMDKSPRTGL